VSVSTAQIDGIATRYAVAGTGPPLLMFSPGGFGASMDAWEKHGLYHRTRMLAQLQERFSCITFDKRESGESGGRVEQVTWSDYAIQGIGLLDHLGIGRAHIMGGCVGCSIAALVATTVPDRVSGMVLYSPAGGVKYRMKQHSRFADHLAYVRENGLAGVAALASTTDAGFSEDARVGPWVTVLRRDAEFAARYVSMDRDRYQAIVTGMSRCLFDRDTVPGPEPEELLATEIPALIVPGEDSSHAPSAARYLQECLPVNRYWDVPVAEQTADTAPARVIDFLVSLAF
jgi:pimeloyl-ACP methyl ester carboxylesterase